jgi:hypothetical protein
MSKKWVNKLSSPMGSLTVDRIKVDWGLMKRGDSVILNSKQSARNAVEKAKKYWGRFAKAELIREGLDKGKFRVTLTGRQEKSCWV